MNTDQGATANIGATFYDVSGTATGPITANVLPNLNTIFDQRNPNGLPSSLGNPSSYQGAVVLSSNTQVAAVVNEYGGTNSLGTGFRFDNYNGLSSTVASTSVFLPQLLKNVPNAAQNTIYNSGVAIQNIDPSFTANVTLTYYSTIGGTITHSGISIPPSASKVVDLQGESIIPVGVAPNDYWLGPSLLTSDRPVAVVVNQNGPGELAVYTGFTSANAATTLYFPQIVYNIFDSGMQLNWGTAIMVMTQDQSTADVTITYSFNGTTRSTTKTANPSAIFDQRFDLPAMGISQMYGSAVITSAKPIVALLNAATDSSSKGVRVSTTRAFASGTGKNQVFVPQLIRNVLDPTSGVTFSTALQGEYMGSAGGSFNVTITYYLSNGSTLTQSGVMGPGAPIFLFDQRYSPLSDGTIVSAVVNSTQPFAVTVNMFGSANAMGDASGNYSGQ